MNRLVSSIVVLLISHGIATAQEIRGVCLASFGFRGGGYGSESCRGQLAEIKEMGGNWVALNDYAWMNSVNEPLLRFRPGGGEGDQGQAIKNAHELGLKVLIKPHVWSREFHGNGKWHGDIRMQNEPDWDQWFANYTAYLLDNAKTAQEFAADGFCVGVEYEGTIDQEVRWRKLIADVRAVYKGPICYSAAFLEWHKITWWDAVDVVSITAYWPVGPHENPTDEQIRQSWQAIYDDLGPFAAKWNKPIVFGEIGYTAAAKAAAEPWSHDRGDNYEQQARLYRIAIEECQKRPYMKGLFVWKWFTGNESGRGGGDPYGLQDKPIAREAIKSTWR